MTLELEREEYLGDLKVGAANSFGLFFKNITAGTENLWDGLFLINPGQWTTFPHLSQIAANFLYYRFEYLYFEFKSTSADALNSTNTSLGQILCRVEHNPNLDADTQLYQMLQAHGHFSNRPSTSFKIEFPVKPGYRFVRTRQTTVTSITNGGQTYFTNRGLQANNDLRNFDQGWFEIAYNGFQAATATLGQLWIKYKVQLHRPIMMGGYINRIQRQFRGIRTAGITNAAPLGTSWSAVPTSNLDITVNTSGLVLQLPPDFKTYNFNPNIMQITLRYTGAAVAWVAPGVTGTNCTIAAAPIYSGGVGGAAVTEAIAIYRVTAFTNDSASTAYLTFDGAGTVPTTQVIIEVELMNDDIH